jgi:hypothetical protein
MKHLLEFKKYGNLSERVGMITANWSLIHGEGSFEKEPGYGFFIFSQNGNFSVVYSKIDQNGDEESRIDFYPSAESSPDKKSVCAVRIVAKDGKNRAEKSFKEIDSKNIWDIISLFFDYSDLEKIEKSETDRFLMGFSKGMKNIMNDDKSEEVPSSFKAIFKLLKNAISNSPSIELGSDSQSNKLEDLVKSFIRYFKKN